MAFVYMPRKPALIIMLVLGAICVVDGAVKKDIKEFLVGLGTFVYALVSIVGDRKKARANKNAQARNNSINPTGKP